MWTKGTLLILILFLAEGQAGGATWASNGSDSDVATQHGLAANGDTITLPAGTFQWDTRVSITKAVTIQGAGIGSTFIQDDNATFGQGLLEITLVAALPTRVTGIEFDAGTRTSNNFTGTIICTGLNSNGSTLRVDNCKFDNLYNAALWTFSTIGVFDHNTLIGRSGGQTAAFGFVKGNDWNGSTNGDGAIAAADQFGSNQFFFIEDCTFTNNYASGHLTLVDCQAGGRYVFRNNSVSKWSLESHGLEAQRERSGRAFEIYGNTFSGIDTQTTVTYFRGGVGLIYNNTISGYTSGANFAFINNRLQEHDPQPWGGADGRNPWDVNHASNPFVTGTCSSAGSLTMTDSGKAWTANQWAGYSVRRTGGPSVKTITSMTRSGSTVTVNTSAAHGFSNGDQVFVFGADQTAYNTHWSVTVSDSDTFTFATNYTPVTPATGTMLCSKQGAFSQITSNTATQLTFRDSAFSGVYSLVFQAGDTYEINKVTHTMDMVGRSGGTLLSGTTPSLPGGWNDQTTSPWYEWNNTREAGANVDFATNFPIIASGTHFINDTAKPGYTPYTYPHPLTGVVSPSGGSVAFGAGAGSAAFGPGAGNVTFQ